MSIWFIDMNFLSILAINDIPASPVKGSSSFMFRNHHKSFGLVLHKHDTFAPPRAVRKARRSIMIILRSISKNKQDDNDTNFIN